MPEGLADDTYGRAIPEALGATPERPALWRDPSGGIVEVSRELFEQRDQAGNVLRLEVAKLGRERLGKILAEAIRDPDEICAVSAGGKPVLRRAFLARLVLADGRIVVPRFEWTPSGWTGLTAFDASESYLERQRVGPLLYRRR